MSSTKEYCLGAENHTNSWCKQLLRMYKEYNRNQQIIEDVRFTKEMIFTYHMINTDDSREGRGKWLEINFKCFGNIGHFKNIKELEKFYDTRQLADAHNERVAKVEQKKDDMIQRETAKCDATRREIEALETKLVRQVQRLTEQTAEFDHVLETVRAEAAEMILIIN